MSDGIQNPGDTSPRHRRSSITQAALSNLFQMGNSGNPQPDPQRRRLSVTTLGLSGTGNSAAATFAARRGSLSANSNNSDSLDESAIEDDEATGGPRTAPTTPFTRRMSYSGSMRGPYRPGQAVSPGIGNTSPSSPPAPSSTGRKPSQSQQNGTHISAYLARRRESSAGTTTSQASNTKHAKFSSDNASRSDQQGFNWSEQLRSRAESAVASGPRPSFSMASSPPRAAFHAHHDRAKSVSDMPNPAQLEAPKAPQPNPKKPDAFQERILKGDFYMD